MDIKRGDTVQVITGKDRGKSGAVLKVLPRRGAVLVEGLNLYKKHRRPKSSNEKGEVVTVSRPLRMSNVALVCGSCKRGVRIGWNLEGKKKIRYCKKCNTPV